MPPGLWLPIDKGGNVQQRSFFGWHRGACQCEGNKPLHCPFAENHDNTRIGSSSSWRPAKVDNHTAAYMFSWVKHVDASPIAGQSARPFVGETCSVLSSGPRMAMARNNEQSRAGRGDVKIFTHQAIWLPLLSLLPYSHSSSSSFFVFFFLCWGKNVLPGAAWQMKMRKREKRRPKRKKRGGGGKWKVVLKCFATLVGFSFLTFQFKQTICWLGDVPSVVIEGGEWLQLAEK